MIYLYENEFSFGDELIKQLNWIVSTVQSTVQSTFGSHGMCCDGITRLMTRIKGQNCHKLVSHWYLTTYIHNISFRFRLITASNRWNFSRNFDLFFSKFCLKWHSSEGIVKIRTDIVMTPIIDENRHYWLSVGTVGVLKADKCIDYSQMFSRFVTQFTKCLCFNAYVSITVVKRPFHTMILRFNYIWLKPRPATGIHPKHSVVKNNLNDRNAVNACLQWLGIGAGLSTWTLVKN